MVRRVAMTVVRVFCPVAAETLAAIVAGDAAALEADPLAAPVIAAIRAAPVIGDFGLYRAVMEVGPGLELFTPAAGAQPTLGTPGQASASPTAVLTLHVRADVPDAELDAALAAILAAHPWETPVVDILDGHLAVRG